MPTVNWDETSTFDLLPEGTYTAEVVKVDEKTLENGLCWNVQFRVVDGPYTDRWFYDSFYLYGKALGKLKIAYKAFGLSVSGQDDIAPTDIVGKKADITVIHGEYQSKSKPKGELTKQLQVPFDGYRKPYSPDSKPYEENATPDRDEARDETPPF